MNVDELNLAINEKSVPKNSLYVKSSFPRIHTTA